MSILGTDYSAVPDLNFSRTRTGIENLAEALARRLMTPRGGLFYDPEYGLDVRDWLNETDSEESRFGLATLVAAECENDPRVYSADAEVERTGERRARISIALETLAGPFRLVLGIGQVNVEVLSADAL